VNGTILLEVAVRSLQDDYELSARIVQAPSNQNGLWPHNNNPKTFVSIIQDFHRDYQNGPIVVMDRYAKNFILANSLGNFTISDLSESLISLLTLGTVESKLRSLFC